MSQIVNSILDEPNQENPPKELFVELIPTTLSSKSTPIEMESNKKMSINPNLNIEKTQQLI